MTIRLIMDSGAFGVWSKGNSIDLDKYIEFCRTYPEVDYYVNLDVIPGRPGVKSSITTAAVEQSCKDGYANYRRMLREVPDARHKVIPVYHMNDDVRWLDRYLNDGVEYIGISPANDRSTADKIKWMKTIRPLLFDRRGEPVVRTHGFAVTSYDLMNFWEWHSVDSASWKLTAAWGAIYVPRKTKGEYDYSKPPMSVGVSPMSPTKAKPQMHFTSMTPLVKEMTQEYLTHIGIPMGEWTIGPEEAGYKITRGSEECWYNKKAGIVLKPIEKGVGTSFEERARANIKFMRESNKVLPVKYLYLAGAPMPYPVETKMTNRLLCFHDVGKKSGAKTMKRHLDTMKGK